MSLRVIAQSPGSISPGEQSLGTIVIDRLARIHVSPSPPSLRLSPFPSCVVIIVKILVTLALVHITHIRVKGKILVWTQYCHRIGEILEIRLPARRPFLVKNRGRAGPLKIMKIMYFIEILIMKI